MGVQADDAVSSVMVIAVALGDCGIYCSVKCKFHYADFATKSAT